MRHEASEQVHPPPRRRGPLRFVLDLFSNVWFGMTTLTALLVYMSVGSAIPPVRQLPMFEMTEFEWFNWWPFTLAIAVLCVNMAVVTVRRIPLTRINLGVWMIHTGIITMALGGVYYFSTKVEGDTPVIRRQIDIATPDGRSGALVALPGARASLGEYEFQVVTIDPQWPILSGKHRGEQAYSVSVLVSQGERQFIRQLLAGYPQYTEDIIPGVGRAVRETGETLLDRDLRLSLAPLPQDQFFLMHSRALYLRRAHEHHDDDHDHHDAGFTPWSMRTLGNLPRYNDYVRDIDDVWPMGPQDRPLRRELGVEARLRAADPFEDVTIHVTGFLRYAAPEARWVEGGDALNPAADVTVRAAATGAERRFQLVAFDPDSFTTPGGEIELAWINDEAEFAQFTTPQARTLTLEVPALGAVVEVPTDRTVSSDPALGWTPIGETGYTYRLRFLADGLTLAEGATVSVAVIDLRTPDAEFTRWVSDDPSFVRDMPPDAGDFSQAMPLRPEIVASYDPGRIAAPVTLVAGPDPQRLRTIVFDGEAARIVRDIRPGEHVDVGAGIELHVPRYTSAARLEARPRIVPRRQRDRDAGEFFSMIQVEIQEAGARPVRRWLPYNHYIFDTPNYAYSGRFAYQPAAVTLSDGRSLELMFGRQRAPLPAPVVLDDFVLSTRIGGFTGQVSSIRDWTSHVRFQTDDGWTPAMRISTNNPVSTRGFWFFQASWDPPQAAPGPLAPASAGLNFTGLGVGNRNGVYTMLAGCSLAVAGMIYAFYVKPALKRRRVQRVYAQVAAAQTPQRTEPDLAAPEPVAAHAGGGS